MTTLRRTAVLWLLGGMLAAGASPAADPALRDLVATGWRAYAQGQLTAAREAYARAVTLAPDDASLWYDLGCILARSREEVEARAAFSRALEREPRHAAAHDAYGQLEELRGNLPAARDGYRRAHQLDDGEEKYLRHLARASLRLGEEPAAREALRRLLGRSPNDPEARYALGVLELRADEPDLAIADFRRTVALAPAHLLGWNGLALAHLAVGELDAAADALHHARALAPRDAVTLTHIGLLAAHEGRWDDAREAWAAALRHDPACGPAARNLERLRQAPAVSAP